MSVQSKMLTDFPRLSKRIGFIQLSSNHMQNFEIWHYINVFESYVYGVSLEYERICKNLPKPSSTRELSNSPTELRLDIYYYTLTWDKLRKVFEKFSGKISSISMDGSAVTNEFKNDFRNIRIRIDHLLKELRITVRNEYEHPSLEVIKIGNRSEWGNLFSDSQGNVKVHIGKDEFAVVRKDHVDRLNSLWIELIDVFLKHFSNKTSSIDLIKAKMDFENNIDNIIKLYKQYLKENKEEAMQLLHQVLIFEANLSMEGFPLSQDIRNKLYSNLYLRETKQKNTKKNIQG